jgi:hypothetical protein
MARVVAGIIGSLRACAAMWPTATSPKSPLRQCVRRSDLSQSANASPAASCAYPCLRRRRSVLEHAFLDRATPPRRNRPTTKSRSGRLRAWSKRTTAPRMPIRPWPAVHHRLNAACPALCAVMTPPRPLTRQLPLPMAHVREHLRAQSFLITNNRLLASVNTGKDTLAQAPHRSGRRAAAAGGKGAEPGARRPRQPNPHRDRSVAQRPRSPPA